MCARLSPLHTPERDRFVPPGWYVNREAGFLLQDRVATGYGRSNLEAMYAFAITNALVVALRVLPQKLKGAGTKENTSENYAG